MLNLDLNLLRALKALLEEKHVTRAAQRIGLSQPAMSRALQRLRQVFKDSLLVKGATGFELTNRAIELYQPLQAIFLQLKQLLAPPYFDPATTQAEISIAARDYEIVTILPAVIKTLTQEAPHLKLRFVPLIDEEMSVLVKQEVDFILSATESNAAMLHQKKIAHDNFVCLLSTNQAKEPLTLTRFIEMKHCLITISGVGPGIVDQVLAEQGLAREIAIRIPHFLAASHLVAQSNLIITLPCRLAELLSDNQQLSIVEPPFLLPNFTIYLYWHSRNQHSLLHQWVREKIAGSAKI